MYVKKVNFLFVGGFLTLGEIRMCWYRRLIPTSNSILRTVTYNHVFLCVLAKIFSSLQSWLSKFFGTCVLKECSLGNLLVLIGYISFARAYHASITVYFLEKASIFYLAGKVMKI